MARVFVAASSQSLDLGAAAQLDITGNITVIGWIQQTSITALRILSADQHAGSFLGWAIGSNYNTAGKFDYYSNTIGFWNTATLAHNDGNWHHVGIVITGTGAGAGVFYLDGATNGTWTHTAPNSTSGTNKRFAARDGGTTPWSDCTLAEWAVWNIALSGAQVASVFAGVSPLTISPANLVGYWPMAGVSPEPDFSGHGNAGVLANAPATAAGPTIMPPPPVTVTLTVGTGTQQWTPAVDCLVIQRLDIWGPGGSGGKLAGRVTGGGAGAYNAIYGPLTVAQLLVSGTVPYQTGRGGAAQATAGTNGNPGSAKTWFSAIGTYAADLGLGGQQAGSGTVAGGVGGLVANCVPTTNGVAGGSGGTCSSATGASGGGASGSLGGAGVTAVAVSTGIAGAGGTAVPIGGSGGAATITTTVAVSGSSPGGGGGGHNNATNNSGAGADGAILVTYLSQPQFSQYQRLAQMQPILAQ